MVVTYEELLARANRGYDWLFSDEARALDFDVARINPDVLDIGSGSDCALAQASGFGDYSDAIEWLHLYGYPVTTPREKAEFILNHSWGGREPEPEYNFVSIWERYYGFHTTPGDGNFVTRVEVCHELTRAWRQVIKERRDA